MKRLTSMTLFILFALLVAEGCGDKGKNSEIANLKEENAKLRAQLETSSNTPTKPTNDSTSNTEARN